MPRICGVRAQRQQSRPYAAARARQGATRRGAIWMSIVTAQRAASACRWFATSGAVALRLQLIHGKEQVHDAALCPACACGRWGRPVPGARAPDRCSAPPRAPGVRGGGPGTAQTGGRPPSRGVGVLAGPSSSPQPSPGPPPLLGRRLHALLLLHLLEARSQFLRDGPLVLDGSQLALDGSPLALDLGLLALSG